MKITKRQLRRIIEEEVATVNKDAIEDTVMDVLSDEGGAAGIEPIEDALEDLEDDESDTRKNCKTDCKTKDLQKIAKRYNICPGKSCENSIFYMFYYS